MVGGQNPFEYYSMNYKENMFRIKFPKKHRWEGYIYYYILNQDEPGECGVLDPHHLAPWKFQDLSFIVPESNDFELFYDPSKIPFAVAVEDE